MYKLVLQRHGESVWNKENIFTGWTNVDLSEKGEEEAKEAGRILRENGFSFDIAFTSVLKRATKTLDITLNEMGHKPIPIKRSWRLNERHYGALQGMNKAEIAGKYGQEKFMAWRRSYDVRPPALRKNDRRYPGKDPLYKGLDDKDLPATECLKDVVKRFLPLWYEEIAPAVITGKRVLVSAHGNSLRALVKFLDNISDDEIPRLNIPTGIPLVYELDKDLKPLRHYYLGDQEKVAKATQAVAEQGSVQ